MSQVSIANDLGEKRCKVADEERGGERKEQESEQVKEEYVGPKWPNFQWSKTRKNLT